MYFKKDLVGKSHAAKTQYADVQNNRRAYTLNELNYVKNGLTLKNNVGLIPQDVYKDFDNVTVERMRSDDGDTYLNDLLPLSTSVNIGKLIHRFRQASDAGLPQTSIGGQTGVKMDQVDYKNDGTIIPIHDAGFFRQWREWNAQQSEGFDALIDDQRETVAAVRDHLATQFLDGHVDKNGSFIVIDGLEWQGMRNDSRVAQVSLVFDFTDPTKTGEEIKQAFITEIRDVLWINNNCSKDVTYYVSRQIASIWEGRFSDNYNSQLIQQEIASLFGVKEIKITNKLTGNQIMGFPLESSIIRPIVGMGLNTVAMPRPVYNSNFEFVTWGAIGFQVREDFFGNTCVIYAET